jgi:ADP-ribosylglycohydrolase
LPLNDTQAIAEALVRVRGRKGGPSRAVLAAAEITGDVVTVVYVAAGVAGAETGQLAFTRAELELHA